MTLSPRSFRATVCVALLAVALLPVACSSKSPQEHSESTASIEQAAQPHANGLPPDRFLSEFGAMGYAIDVPWSDGGGNGWGAEAHKIYENNQLILAISSGTQSRVDRIELNALVSDGAISPQMQEAFEVGVRTCFAGMDLRIPDGVVDAVRNQSAHEGEAGRFGVQLVRVADPSGGYTQSLRMVSR